MSTVTKIEWADRTWSPLLGCRKVSPGCDNCYAIRTVHRLSHNPNPKVGPLYQGITRREAGETDWTGAVVTVPGRLADPLSWKAPQRIFVNSQSDLFHQDVPEEFIADVFGVMAATPQHTYQVLTKRHARMRALLSRPDFRNMVHDDPSLSRSPWPLQNVHLGVSVEDQQWADIRIPALLGTPAAVRWVSAEPLLGPIDLDQPRCDAHGRDFVSDDGQWCTECSADGFIGELSFGHWLDPLNGGISWVVVGGESGPGARPMDLAWAEQIVRQCRGEGVPVLVKQLGTVTGGKTHHDIESFPPSLRVREYPTTPDATR